MLLRILAGVVAGLLLAWGCLVLALLVARPRKEALEEALRLLPDTLRLVRDLAKDDSLPRGIRIRLGLLLAYLAFPIDLIPDFIPILGYADDAIIVCLVLRSVVRRAGAEALHKHWKGSADGLEVIRRIAGV